MNRPPAQPQPEHLRGNSVRFNRPLSKNAGLGSSYTKRSYLEGKVAIVTGSSDGIGYAIAKRLAYEGAYVVVSSRKQGKVDRAVATLHAQGLSNVSGIVCHVGNKEDRQALVEHTVKLYGGVDILVSNVGMNLSIGLVMNTTEEAWDKVMDINLKSAFQLTQEVVPHLIKRGCGAIVYVSSLVGFLPHPLIGAYSIAKAGLNALTRIMSKELAKDNIRVNCIAPGLIRTKMSDEVKNYEVSQAYLEHGCSMKRVGEPDEMGGLVAFLCSQDASYITGEIICATGGSQSRL